MPNFIILRLERTPTTIQDFPAFSVRALPLFIIKGQPFTLEADDAETALGMAIRRYPHFRHILAVQGLSEYESQHTSDASWLFRSAKAGRAHA